MQTMFNPELVRFAVLVPHAAAPGETYNNRYEDDDPHPHASVRQTSQYASQTPPPKQRGFWAQFWHDVTNRDGQALSPHLLQLLQKYPQLAGLLGGGMLGGLLGGRNRGKWALGLGAAGLAGGYAWHKRDDIAKGIGEWMNKLSAPSRVAFGDEITKRMSAERAKFKEDLTSQRKALMSDFQGSGLGAFTRMFRRPAESPTEAQSPEVAAPAPEPEKTEGV